MEVSIATKEEAGLWGFTTTDDVFKVFLEIETSAKSSVRLPSF